jgi:hypothetical protein
VEPYAETLSKVAGVDENFHCGATENVYESKDDESEFVTEVIC